MDQEFALAGKGLRYLLLAEILILVGIVVAFVPILGQIVFTIAILAAKVLRFVGPYVARTAHPNFQTAFYVTIIEFAVELISGLLPEKGVLAVPFEIVSTLLRFAITYLILTAAQVLVNAKGDSVLANRAALLWKLYGGCILLSVLNTIIGGIPVLNVLAGIAGVVSTVVSVVGYVLLILFYYKASQFLCQP